MSDNLFYTLIGILVTSILSVIAFLVKRRFFQSPIAPSKHSERNVSAGGDISTGGDIVQGDKIINYEHDEKTTQEEDGDDEYNKQRAALEGFKADFESFLRRLEVEWDSERDSRKDTDEAKFVLDGASSDLIDFLGVIVSDKDLKLTNILKEAVERSKAIQNHRFRLDTGVSHRTFWEEGNQIITLLKKVPKEIDDILDE